MPHADDGGVGVRRRCSARDDAGLYHVYVVECRPHGPKDLRDRSHVYVGSTFLEPEVRLEHHLRGQRASRHVRRFGVRLRPELAPRQGFGSREEAKAAEQRTARVLHDRGYVVWGSCSPRVTKECVL